MENKKKSIDRYSIIQKIFLFAPLMLVLGVRKTLDNDTYWIIKTGEYITKHGIPTKDFLTMHKTMDLVVQQWLSDVIYYKLYHAFGTAGPIALAMIMYVVIIGLIIKLNKTLGSGKLASSLATLYIGVIMYAYAVTRPQIFTYAIILIELICLESYVKKGKWQYLIPLPILSVLEVNLHASMYTMLFIMMLPYIANAIPIKIKKKSIACCKLLPLLATAVVMIGTGFLTPYGIKGMSFIFTTSVGNKVNSDISELTPITVSPKEAMWMLGILLVIICYVLYFRVAKKPAPIRYHLLIVGTMIMGLAYRKLTPYFLIGGITVAATLVRNYKIPIKKKFEDPKFNKVIGTEIMAIMVILIALTIYSPQISLFTNNSGSDKNARTNIEQLDDTIKVLDKEDKDNMVLFNGFNTGAYLEFKGYTTYIDPRADSFIVEANHEFDYLTEYKDAQAGDMYYKDFVNKYHFTHLLIENKVETPLLTSLSHDSNYKILYENDRYTLFKAVK